MERDRCINCGEELSIIERNRSECLDCRDRTFVTHSEDEE
jgi:DNA-directed RNA polymerase subunit RPC12/RpoP